MESAACTSLPPPLHTHTVKHMDTHTVVSIPWPPRGVRPVPVSAVRGINSHYWQAKRPVQVYLSRYHTPCAKQNELIKTHGTIVGEVGEIPCFDFQDSNSIETAASEFSHLHKKKHPICRSPRTQLRSCWAIRLLPVNQMSFALIDEQHR